MWIKSLSLNYWLISRSVANLNSCLHLIVAIVIIGSVIKANRDFSCHGIPLRIDGFFWI